MEQVRQARLDLHRQMLESRLGDNYFGRNEYVDVLMQCCISKVFFWFRQNSFEEDSLVVGSHVLITNVNDLYYPSSIAMFGASKNSTIKQVRVNEDMSTDVTALMATTLFARRKTIEIRTQQEIYAITCSVVLYTVEQEDGDSENHLLKELKVFCLALQEPQVGLFLVCQLPSTVINRLDWLFQGACIEMNFPIIRAYDQQNDIFEVGRGDHSSIRKLSSVNASFTVIPPEILQEEQCRFEAIMRSEKYYRSVIHNGNLHECKRSLNV